MRHVVRKLFWVWNYDKEEKWLNEMAAKGLCLISEALGSSNLRTATPENIRSACRCWRSTPVI